MSKAPILEFDGVRIAYTTRRGELLVVPRLDFSVGSGEAFGLVGESGCGKSTVAYAVMGYLGAGGRVLTGEIRLAGRNIVGLGANELRRLRGSKVAMIYQDPMSCLNPTMRIGRQLLEVLEEHLGDTGPAARSRVVRVLSDVRLPGGDEILGRYPHQLSGGQQQRIVIAMALLAEPVLLVMDEPTTGLDVTVEAAVLDLVDDLRRKHGRAVLFISHNLGVVARVCERVGVMYAGEIVEEGPVRRVFRAPCHPYTRGLLASMPAIQPGQVPTRLETIPGQVPPLNERPAGCAFRQRCDFAVDACMQPVPLDARPGDVRVRCVRAGELPAWRRVAARPDDSERLSEQAVVLKADGIAKTYERRTGLFGRSTTRAVDGASAEARRGTTLAIVGESGSGKSTFAKIVTGLEVADAGTMRIGAEEVANVPVEARSVELTRRVQMVFQNPDATLNPSHTIGYAVGRAVQCLTGLTGPARENAVATLLEKVRLPADVMSRFPRQLSGGQKQRVAIARALAGGAGLLVADEPVSALDMSVQASILNLLSDLQAEAGTTIVLISHDLAVVHHLADVVAVMYQGKIVESGPVEAVFAPPWHPYTAALLSAAPRIDETPTQVRLQLEPASAASAAPQFGCVFAARCPRKVGSLCDSHQPPEQDVDGHRIACHIPRSELSASGELTGT